MKIEIDQSGKIEQTEKDTILCLSNDSWYALKIKASTKRQIQKIFRYNNQIRNFVLFTFCAGLAILFKKSKPQTKVTIDEEYFGKNAIINNVLKSMLTLSKSPVQIDFRRIGKGSHAHFLAGEISKGRKKPTCVISFDQILKQIKKTEVGKRLKNA